MTIYNHNNLFLDNKYTKWYYSIIERAQSQDRKKRKSSDPNYVYYEEHHVLPRCKFPEYANFTQNKWNRAFLTAKEHYICHWLLINMTADKDAQIRFGYALRKLLTDKRNSRTYEYNRIHKMIITRIGAHTNDVINSIKASNAGMGLYKDKHGNKVRCSVDDPRVLSGELVGQTKGVSTKGVNKGFCTAIDTLTGENVRIPCEELDGIRYVGTRKGCPPSEKCSNALREYALSEEGRLRSSKQFKGVPKSDEHKKKIGLGTKGSKWYNNGEENKRFKPGEEQPGWLLGMLSKNSNPQK